MRFSSEYNLYFKGDGASLSLYSLLFVGGRLKLVSLGILVVVLLFTTGCMRDDSFVLHGELSNASSIKTVALYEGDRKLDSVFLTENGKFKIERIASQPRLFTLVAGRNKYYFIAENGDELTFKADLAQQSDVYEIGGGELSAKIKSFASAKRRQEEFERTLETEFVGRSVGLNDNEIQELRLEFLRKHKDGMAAYIQEAVTFAEQHDDLAGFFAMSSLDPEIAEAEIVAYANRIDGQFPNNATVKRFLEEAERIKQLAVGQPAPEFESYTYNNQRVSLSDFKGKYTLVDFWASWCVPCREENPNIVKQYHRFKDKGFTVLGVSLDGNPGSWLRAVEEDKLDWTQVSDLQQWGSDVVGLYRIKAIPTSYLVDPEGIILAKNLRGRELEEFLTRTLN